MGGIGSGRKKETKTRTRAIQSLTNKLPQAIDVISEVMEGKITDRLRYEAAISIKDSVIGKPKQQTEITGGEEIGMGVIQALLAQIYQDKPPLQLNYKPLGIEESKEEAVNTTDNES